jgi:homoserine kinase
MPPTSVTVRVPATSANLGPGFDALGMALDLAGEVTVSWSRQAAPLPQGPAEQLALAAAKAVFAQAGRPAPDGLHARYHGAIPVGRGLGASAVLRTGAVMAANALLGEPFDREHMLSIAAELEGHADNVAPALLGGFQVCVWTERGILHVPVPLPEGLQAVLFVPELEMPTNESRKLLPASLTRQECVYNIGRAALLVAGMAAGRLDVLDEATRDVLHQPARTKLFPAMPAIFDAARAAGALCAYLSGGGSAIMALAVEHGQQIGAAMAACARAAGHAGQVILTRPSVRGAEIVAGG